MNTILLEYVAWIKEGLLCLAGTTSTEVNLAVDEAFEMSLEL